MNFKQVTGVLVCAAAFGLSPAMAQPASVARQSPQTLAAQRQALGALMKVMTVDYQQTRLEAVLKNITDVTGAPMVILWADERNPVGLDKETLVTFGAVDQTALTVLEGVLAQLGGDPSIGGSSWQMTEGGQIEVGPKQRLNRTRRLEIYDISDLLLEVPDYNSVPQFDLNTALQASSGGGSGSSPFSGGGTQTNQNPGKPEAERADEVIRIIVDLVEPDQWTNNGGSAATVRYYKKQLLVTAPDYIQRQINGYPFWPAEQTQVNQSAKSRSVTLLPPKSPRVVQTAKIAPAPASGPAPASAETKTAEPSKP